MTATSGLIDRCSDLAPALAARAADAEALRNLPSATIDDALAAGLFAAVVPTALGGDGLGLGELAQATRVMANGCPASAWTLSFLMMHGWLLSKFPAEGVAEFFDAKPYALAPAPLAPTGTATPTDGGWVVNGRWEWATGVMHSDWVMVHAVEKGGPLATRFVVLPRVEVEVDDVWFTAGMRATGSNTIRVDQRFVPAHRTLPAAALLESTNYLPGDGLARVPVASVLALVASAPALGAAEAAVELFRTRLVERVLAYSFGDKAAEQPAAQIRLATAMSDLAAARDHWETAIAAVEHAAAGTGPDERLRVATRLAAAATVRAARGVINTVCEGAGASVYFTGHPLQRLQRDVETLKGHVIFDWDRTAELAGRVALGISPRPTDLI